MTNAPVLTFPDYSKYFIAVLSQLDDTQERVVAYASRTLRKVVLCDSKRVT